MNRRKKQRGDTEYCGYCKYHNTDLTWVNVRIKKCLHRNGKRIPCKHFEHNMRHPKWMKLFYTK